VLAFSFTGRADVDLWYEDSGCSYLDNGTIGAASVNDFPAFNAFALLVDKDAPPRKTSLLGVISGGSGAPR
jgi:hypothetical protein